MYDESILKFDAETESFGEVLWLVCQVCWNHMKQTTWEDGRIEEECPACRRMAWAQE